MTSEFICHVLLWPLAINYGILIGWFLVFVFAHNWLRTLHGKWFKLSDNSFDAIHYSDMAACKIGILMFSLVPLISLCLVRSGAPLTTRSGH